MKNRFTTLDLIAILPEIREQLCGMRVYQVYDVDSKTVIIRFSKPAAAGKIEEETFKQMLILESGIRMHLTEFNWPKNTNPSGFTMKLRKHLRNKRLESIKQIGIDRIVDLQFGTGDYTNHLILELYSKGNILLTDKDYTILSLVRIYKDVKTNINIAVREKYPIDRSLYIADQTLLTRERILDIIQNSKDDNFKKLFNPQFQYGPALLEHSLLQFKDVNVNKFKVAPEDCELLEKVFQYSDQQVKIFSDTCSRGYIIESSEKRANADEVLVTYSEFHPYLFAQYKTENTQYKECDSFNKAVDLFFSNIEGQKIESKAVQQEKQALKKLEAIKKDHVMRLENLSKMQAIDNKKAELIENNIELVEKAISVLRSAIANKYSWEMILEIVKDAQDSGDLIASKIRQLKLDKNCFEMLLDDPFDEDKSNQMLVDIDIGLSAFANARKYYDHRKDAAKKEQKTIDHSEKAFKNVERKVKQQLKETAVKTNIVLARKILWFEKFFWFISSEGILVIAGRDAQQNELIVKRYLDKNDIYVHADIHGATSVVIKNYTDGEVPPKTLNEAANMAVCYSASWDAKVVSVAYWVHSHQVQKTAPTGQYLSVGSFMIRGKKNYIPLQNLIMGFGFVFRIDDESIEHRQKLKEKEQKENEKLEETSEFPDTTIKLKTAFDVDQPNDDYTIVTTGDIKKKVKIFTQKDLNKKAVQQTKNAKKKGKRGKNPMDSLVEETGHMITIGGTEANSAPEPEKKEENVAEEEKPAEVETPEEKEEEEQQQEEEEEIEDDDQDAPKKDFDAQKLINSLVVSPEPEDNLLYAVPVCAPYSSMNAYKFKVKLIPGSTKRGKASKTALAIFLKEKSATEREKDLLKAIKDQDISKNMPSKVKIITSHAAK